MASEPLTVYLYTEYEEEQGIKRIFRSRQDAEEAKNLYLLKMKNDFRTRVIDNIRNDPKKVRIEITTNKTPFCRIGKQVALQDFLQDKYTFKQDETVQRYTLRFKDKSQYINDLFNAKQWCHWCLDIIKEGKIDEDFLELEWQKEMEYIYVTIETFLVE